MQLSLRGHLLHGYRWLARPPYRSRCREISRLRRLPRYQSTVTRLTGLPLEIPDALSFLDSYSEIWERQVYRFQSRSPRPYIIDGGANVGLAVSFFKEVWPESEIVAFEPDEKLFACLERNVSNNALPGVTLVRRALWSSETTLEFHSEGSDAGRIARETDFGTSRVPTARLRDYLVRPVDFLKLDVEGSETEILADCAGSLGAVQSLFVESHSFAHEKQTLPALLQILSEAGFRLHLHAPPSSPRPLISRTIHHGMDLQVHVFAYRP
jgi:FkbM family methyltransferase